MFGETEAETIDVMPRVRQRLNADEFMALAESGALGDRTNVELTRGMLVELPPEGTAHGENKSRSGRVLDRIVERMAGLKLGYGTAVEIDAETVVGPDIVVYAAVAGKPSCIPAESVQLVVEHAYSTRKYDLEEKSLLYAEAGVPELWVLDNVRNVLHRFHNPSGGLYRADPPRGLDERVQVPFAPRESLRVGELFDLD